MARFWALKISPGALVTVSTVPSTLPESPVKVTRVEWGLVSMTGATPPSSTATAAASTGSGPASISSVTASSIGGHCRMILQTRFHQVPVRDSLRKVDFALFDPGY